MSSLTTGRRTYMVSMTTDLDSLDEAVTQLMSEGWDPLGGVAMMMRRESDGEGHWYTPNYAQAMVRR